MKLLDPNEIREEKSESQEQAQERTHKLASEESRLARQINLAREDAKIEIGKIDAEVAEHRRKAEAEKTGITQDIDRLKSERKELLKPIDEIRNDVQVLLSNAELRDIESKRKAEDVAADHEKNLDVAEGLADRKDDLDEREQKLETRELGIKNEEARLKQSNDTLAADWTALHKAVHANNEKTTALEEREQKASIQEKANADRAEALDKQTAEIRLDRIAIRSGYDALETAKKHLGIKP